MVWLDLWSFKQKIVEFKPQLIDLKFEPAQSCEVFQWSVQSFHFTLGPREQRPMSFNYERGPVPTSAEYMYEVELPKEFDVRVGDEIETIVYEYCEQCCV